MNNKKNESLLSGFEIEIKKKKREKERENLRI